jgi:hypothetical protein
MPVRLLVVTVAVLESHDRRRRGAKPTPTTHATTESSTTKKSGGGGRRGSSTSTKPATTQTFAQSEKDPASPRHSQLKSKKPDASEIVRIDVDHDGDPDILEHWWNGKPRRWIDENDDMKPTDRAAT